MHWSNSCSSQWKSFIDIRLDNCMNQKTSTFIAIPVLLFSFPSQSPKMQGIYLNSFFFFPSESHLGRTLHFGIPEFSMSNRKNLKISLKRFQECICTYFHFAYQSIMSFQISSKSFSSLPSHPPFFSRV